MNTDSKAFLVRIAVADLLLVGVGTFAARYDNFLFRADRAFLMFAVAAVGIVTFFGLLLVL